MKIWLSITFVLVSASNTFGLTCPDRAPSYIRAGADRMVGTEQAEDLACRRDEELSESGTNSATVRNRRLTNEQVRAILSAHPSASFYDSRFIDAIDIDHEIGSAIFERCEFEGAVRVISPSAREIHIRDSLFHQGLEIEGLKANAIAISGSVIMGKLSFLECTLVRGATMTSTRIAGPVDLNAMESDHGLSFEAVRFLDTFTLTAPEIHDRVSFRSCEWTRDARISFAYGSIGALRFDGCDFDGRWLPTHDEKPAQIRLTGVNVGTVALPSAASEQFPSLRVSRSLISHLRLPDWNVARNIVITDSEPATDAERESFLEVLGLTRSSYEREGRQRDALAVARLHRLEDSRFRGNFAYTMNLVRNWTETSILYIFAIVVLIAAVIYWSFEQKNQWRGRLLSSIAESLDASWTAVVTGPDAKRAYKASSTIVALRLVRVIGAVVLFYVVARIQELFNG